MADAIYKTFKNRLAFARSKLSTGTAPTAAQTAAFLRELVSMLRPHIGGARSLSQHVTLALRCSCGCGATAAAVHL